MSRNGTKLTFPVKGHGFVRQVQCAKCGEWSSRSILPHIRKEHAKLWRSWVDDFVALSNSGLTPKRIMTRYGRLFTWSVIEKELRRVGTHNASRLSSTQAKINEWRPSRRSFRLEKSTVWSFPKRGDWCVHSSEYRGNWPPQIPRNLILRFTRRNGWVLDPFVGSGTSAIECLLEGRNFIGLDVSPWAIRISKRKIRLMRSLARGPGFQLPRTKVVIKRGDARSMRFVKDCSIDLICAHPPYWDTLSYTDGLRNDLSQIHDIAKFGDEMAKVAAECYRVLKRKRLCAILIGDVRRRGKLIPLEQIVCRVFLNAGFRLRDRIVKLQYHDRSTAFYTKISRVNRFLIGHEFLLLFERNS